MRNSLVLLAACGLLIGRFASAQTSDAVLPAAPGKDEQAAPAQPAKDAATAVQDITAALRAEHGLPADAISVAVHAETVVLSGKVGDAEQAARALSIAREQSGGVRVSSHVEVREEAQASPLSTQALALVHEVERALKQDRRTTSLGVAVSIDDDQVVSLHGLVPSRDSRAAAEEVAARVSGVKSVSSRLVVAGE